MISIPKHFDLSALTCRRDQSQKFSQAMRLLLSVLTLFHCHCQVMAFSPPSGLSSSRTTTRLLAFSSNATFAPTDNSDGFSTSTTTTNNGTSNQQRRDSNKNNVVDIAIVGAGPAGLLLAHAMIDRGYNVRVLERRSSFRPVGSAVFLHPFAINSLREISRNVATNVINAATQIGTVTVKSTTKQSNTMIFDKFDNAPNVFGAPFVTIKFWDMLQALKIGLDDAIFEFGKEVQGYDLIGDNDSTAEQRVKLYYSITQTASTLEGGGVPTIESINARMVVDASGIRSKIRKQLLPNNSQSVPVCKAYMSVVDAKLATPIMEGNCDDNADRMVDRELSFLVGDVDGMTLSTLDNGDVWWTYTYFDEELESSLSKEELVSRFASSRGDRRYPEFVSKLIDATPTDSIIETVLADLPTSWKWGDGMVTLLGDSAHAQLPALGLGCSAAFADVEEICKQIDKRRRGGNNGLCSDAIRWYERSRMPQTALLQKASRLTFSGARTLGEQK